MNIRKQKLIDLYSKEEEHLMKEFDHMKKQELIEQYNKQSELIEQYRKECHENNEQLRDYAEQYRVKNSNEVRQEKMNLETLKTASFNKFEKE